MTIITEMNKLIAALGVNKVPFQVKPCWDNTIQVIYPADGLERVCDVVCHSFSYGHSEGLLELMGLTMNGDAVEGYLTADEVFMRIYSHYKAHEKDYNSFYKERK